MPGKIVQCLKSAGTENPLLLIDEIDKLGKDKGDPASALLEVITEQNASFLDQFLEFPVDLSKVLFLCTVNEIDNIPGPLLDRMEVISLAGYATDEKLNIARDYLVKTTRRDCGIKPEQVVLSDSALLSLIENYCREPGVRNLKAQIEKIFRKVALKLVREEVSGDVTEDSRADSEINRMTMEEIMKIFDSADCGSSGESKPRQSGEEAGTIVISESNLADYVGKPPVWQ